LTAPQPEVRQAGPKTKHSLAKKPAAKPQVTLPKLVDIGTKRCIPCKMMAPILEELRREQKGKLEVVFIDVGEKQDAGKPYGIRLIPTQILYDAQGEEFYRHEGFLSKADLLAKFRKRGIKLAAPQKR
jgi:thioredoxin 1